MPTTEVLIRTISPNDEMRAGGTNDYFAFGRSALDCVRRSLDAAGLPDERVQHILDLPCGHGRVLRHLKAAFPDATLTACDLLRDGVDFCAATFAAVPVYSNEDPTEIPLPLAAFDLLWAGSLLTHLDADRWADFLNLFRRSLRPGGVAVFTTHGRKAADWLATGAVGYGLSTPRAAAVLRKYNRRGFGYAAYTESQGYGVSMSRPDWVFRLIDRVPQMRLAYHSEAGWVMHQDVYACVFDQGWPVSKVPKSFFRRYDDR